MPKTVEQIETVIWIFNCPAHGYQSHVLCWRAFADEFKGNWHKCRAIYDSLETIGVEIDGHLARMRKNYRT